MRARRYTRVEDLPSGLSEFLAQDDLRNNVSLGVLQRLRSQPTAFPDYCLYVVSERRKIRLYAHETPPFAPLLAQGDPDAIPHLVELLKNTHQRLPGLAGSLLMTERVLDAWPEMRKYLNCVQRQGLWRLERVLMPLASGASYQLAQLQDLELYVSWMRAFCLETGEVYRGESLTHDDQKMRILAGDLHVLTVAGRPVSMAVGGRKLKHGRTVGFVYTPPDKRGKGYATELVALLSQRILKDGYSYCCLFTDLANPISNRIYQRIGYEWVDEFRKYTPSP
jgi:predicted GNAT family acetyltransferase